MSGDDGRRVTIIHFNDVYNIEARQQEPVGGAARFATALARRRHLNPLVVFSGDAFNPSIMSAVTKGDQMVPILNALNVQCAVFGNHDFDFGVGHLVKVTKRSTFPWLLSNVYDNTTDRILAEGLTSHMVTWQGIRFGFIGLVEVEWMDTLATVNAEEITFLDYLCEGRKLATQLRQKGVQFVVALTHMRWPNDLRLAENAPEIDLILGGHDHEYTVKKVAGRYVVKSGTDFRSFSQLTLTFEGGRCSDLDIQEVAVDGTIEEDPFVAEIVRQFSDLMGEKMEKVIGEIEVPLDGRFSRIRTQETNLGNFITDIMMSSSHAELAILNSGTLRSDMIHPPGLFRTRDLLAILPLVDPIVVLKVTGAQVIAALINGVSQYPRHEGRFPQVAGVKFAFDPSEPPPRRVDARYVWIQGEPLDLKRNYRLCTKKYLCEGRDGYDMFKDCPVLVNEDDGPRLSTVIQNHFKSVRMLRDASRKRFTHRQSIIPLHRRKTLVRQLSIAETDSPPTSPPTSPSTSPPTSLIRSRPDRHALQRRDSIDCVEMETAVNALAPRVDGRIITLTRLTQEERERDYPQFNRSSNAIPEVSGRDKTAILGRHVEM